MRDFRVHREGENGSTAIQSMGATGENPSKHFEIPLGKFLHVAKIIRIPFNCLIASCKKVEKIEAGCSLQYYSTIIKARK